MPIDFKCPECKAALRVKDEHAGRKMKCPRCAKVIPIPAPVEDDVIEDVAVVDDEKAADSAALFAFDDDAPGPKPKGKSKSAEPETPRGPTWGKYMACPHCTGREAKRVKWTWWGSWWGPRMFTHVRCLECGSCFNGKTGDSNVIPIILCTGLPAVGIIIILAGLYIVLLRTDNWPPWQKLRHREGSSLPRIERYQS